jgi:uncharacterized membrane protein
MPAAMSSNTHISQSKRDVRHPWSFRSIALIAILGIVVSCISLYHHFGTSKTAFCNFGESFNCDLVNRSSYSTVLGVPVALLGLCGYLLIFALATLYRSKPETPLILSFSTAAGLAFSLYLTYVEKFVLAAWCILCLSSLALISIATILSAALAAKTARAS